jgi:3-methyladenine DNA glycosylase AlkC
MTNPVLLKNLYNKEFIHTLCHQISVVYHPFQSELFTQNIFDQQWEEKELKTRMKHISQVLHIFLPQDYSDAIQILKKASVNFSGLEHMVFPTYVELYGLENYHDSISALELFTQFSSSEFAVRVFIIKYPSKMMLQMEKWAESDNHHVRRLASEGCRPRLPWARSLVDFKNNPLPVLAILKKLKNDQSDYVRRSVANNLNDISKDNPQIVLDIAKKWIGHNPETDWVVKHACRSLLKLANTEVLTLFGFCNPSHISMTEFIIQQSVNFGGTVDFSFTLQTKEQKLGKLRIEYAIDFVKKNNKLARKIFIISESNNIINTKTISKQFSFKPISTRKYYPGKHGFAVIVNGVELVQSIFELNNHK